MNWFIALISHKDNENVLVSRAKHRADFKKLKVQKVKYLSEETVLL